MKAVINIISFALALAGTSSGAYAYELRGGAVVLAGTADNVLLPQVSSDAAAGADEGGRKYDCINDKQYWQDYKEWCKEHGYRYSGGSGSDTKTTCRKSKCQEDRGYFKDYKHCCKEHDWYYDSHDSHEHHRDANEDKCDYWYKHNYEKYHKYCAALSDFFENYKDAELIADVLTGVYDEDFQDENF